MIVIVYLLLIIVSDSINKFIWTPICDTLSLLGLFTEISRCSSHLKDQLFCYTRVQIKIFVRYRVILRSYQIEKLTQRREAFCCQNGDKGNKMASLFATIFNHGRTLQVQRSLAEIAPFGTLCIHYHNHFTYCNQKINFISQTLYGAFTCNQI